MAKIISFIKSAAAKVTPFFVPGIVLTVGILCAASLVVAAFCGSQEQAAIRNRKYILVHLENIQGVPIKVEEILVTHVYHAQDGAICFIGVQDEKRGCIKSLSYILKEAE